MDFNQEEIASFANYINSILEGNPDLAHILPIDPSNNDLFDSVHDGILICKMCNVACPNCLDESLITPKKRLSAFTLLDNSTLGIKTAESIGLNVNGIGPQDIRDGVPSLVLYFLWQLIRRSLIKDINTQTHKELLLLMNKGEKNEEFESLEPEQILLRWINYQLKQSGSNRTAKNYTDDFKDSEILTTVLTQIAPECTNTPLKESDLTKRAELMLQESAKIKCREFVTPQTIVEGRQRLIFAFVANLFNTRPCLNETEKSESDDEQIVESKSDDFFMDEETEAERYTNIGKVGEGATSDTYKLIDKKTQKPICKKILKYNNGQTTMKDAQNALKEFQILYQMDHPGVCKALFINTSETIKIANQNKTEKISTISLFLEFLDFNLKDFLSSNFCTNTMKAKIIVEIVHAMKFIHKNGMIHRDLKIENIMLNSILETKIVDFGLVRINDAVESITKGIGTFAYMSPEMLNEEDYDNKTDVYSFGVILYFILFGVIPKQSLKDKTAGKAIKIPPESDKISKFGRKLIKKCLNPDHSHRPSFEKILTELRKNSYLLFDGIDSPLVKQRDDQLEMIVKKKKK